MPIKLGQLQPDYRIDEAALLLCEEDEFSDGGQFSECMEEMEGMDDAKADSRLRLYNEVLFSLFSWLTIHHEKDTDADIFSPESYHILREDLILWHKVKGLELPEFLVNELTLTDNPDIIKTPHGGRGRSQLKNPKPESKLRSNQRQKAKCRAVAGMLWSKNPNLTQGDIITHPDFITYGCEMTGNDKKVGWSEDTLRGWIKGVDPMPQIGRPKEPR